MITEKTLKKLEYYSILEKVSNFAVSSTAKKLVMQLFPSSNKKQVEYNLSETEQAERLINYNCIPEFNFDNIDEVVDKSKILSTLSMAELLSVMRILRISRQLQKSFTDFNQGDISILLSYSNTLYTDKTIEDDIDFSIVSETEMNDKASDKLYAIRQKIRKTNSDIKIKLTSYTKSGEMSKYMQESIVTIREGRYVIPVKQEYKGYIQGLVHDQSATGATLFIEPLAIVNLNNELKELEISEKDEMEAILKDFTARISKFSPYLRQNQTTIATLDCIFAKAQYGVKIRAIKPIVNDIGYTNLISARHPLIDKNKVVPISIHFGKENDIVVITGPNTGGKTVSLKTVGLLSILSAVGIFVPAEEHSEISVYDNIFCDIGDEQSIEQSLSTFSSHIRNISDILDNVNNKSLVLIDEIGAGTEPNEGSALAVAITEFLLQSGCKAVVTTHYSQLKEFSLITDKIENASMEFNSKTFEPTYKLILGVPGNSNAIDIASTLGLSKEVISCARGKLSDEVVSFEKVLQNAETIRQQYEVKKSETEEVTRNLKIELDKAHRQNDSLTAEREKLLKNSKTEAKRIINEAHEESKELIEQLKSLVKLGNIEEKELFNARSKVKTLVSKKYDTTDDIEENYIFMGDPIDITKLSVGNKVYYKQLNTVVVVASIEKNGKISVKSGNFSTYARAQDLYNYVDDRKLPKQQQIVKTQLQNKVKGNPTEINLLGQTVEEAIENVSEFIDTARINNFATLRIIHGMGTGRLRKGIHDYLKTLPYVKEFRLGNYTEGQSGVTIVTLK